jgi:hypothetical protein
LVAFWIGDLWILVEPHGGAKLNHQKPRRRAYSWSPLRFFIAVIGAFKVRFYSFVFWAVILGVESHDAEPETIRTLTCQSFSVDLCVMHQQF